MAASPGVVDEGADLFAKRDEGRVAAHGGGIFALGALAELTFR